MAVAGETLETSNNKSFQVMVRADSGINSAKDLTGKRVASPGVGSVMHVALLYWVKKDGGDPNRVIGVEAPFTAMMDQLKSGRVDAVEQLEPFVGQILAAYSGLPEAVVSRIPMPHFDFKITPAQLEVWRDVMVSQGFPLQKLNINRMIVKLD